MDIVDWRNFFSLPHNVQRFQLLNQLNSLVWLIQYVLSVDECMAVLCQAKDQVPDSILTDVEQEQLLSFVERLNSIGEVHTFITHTSMCDTN